MIQDIKTAAESVGITSIITNSNEKIETQLNRITGLEELPIMLVSWDLDTALVFNTNGFLDNPSTKVVCLLMDKSEDKSKELREITANDMGGLFQSFLQALYEQLIQYQLKAEEPPITEAGYKLVPKHGAGQHSGILGRFTMKTQVINCKSE